MSFASFLDACEKAFELYQKDLERQNALLRSEEKGKAGYPAKKQRRATNWAFKPTRELGGFDYGRWSEIPDGYWVAMLGCGSADQFQKLPNMPEPKIIDGKVVLRGEAVAVHSASHAELMAAIDKFRDELNRDTPFDGADSSLAKIRDLAAALRPEPALQPITDEAIADIYITQYPGMDKKDSLNRVKAIMAGQQDGSQVLTPLVKYLSTLGTPAPEPAPAPLVVGITVEDLAKLYFPPCEDQTTEEIIKNIEKYMAGTYPNRGNLNYQKSFVKFMEKAAPHIKPRPAPQADQADDGMVRLHSRYAGTIHLFRPESMQSVETKGEWSYVSINDITGYYITETLDEIRDKIETARAEKEKP